jgi:hypothetical protein
MIKACSQEVLKVTARVYRSGRQAAALLVFATACFSTGAQEAKPLFRVSSAGLGPEGVVIPAADIVSALSAQDWCTAREIESTSRWKAPASAAAGENRVSVVTAGFGEQAHAFAFVATNGEAVFSLVAHVPYGKTTIPGGGRVWIPPTGRLAHALRDTWQRRSQGGPRRPVKVRVVSDTGESAPASGASLDELMGEGDAGGSELMHAQAEQASMAPLEAIAAAAALQTGWQPDDGATDELTVSARFGFQSASLRCSLQTSGGKPRSVPEPGVPWDRYHAQLACTFRALHPDSGILDVIRLGAATLPLVATAERVCFAADGELRAYSTETGEVSWSIPAPERGPTPAYVPHPEAKAVLRLRPSLARIDPADGAIVELKADPRLASPPSGGSAYLFDAATETLCAVDEASGNTLWRQPMGDVLLAGPTPCGDALFVATKGNRLMLLTPADGTIRAEVNWPTWLLAARLMRFGPATHVVCYDLGGRVIFLRADDLHVERIVALNAKPAGAPVYAPSLPVPWPDFMPASDDFTLVAHGFERQAALLVPDAVGFCHVLTVPAPAGKEGR